MMSLSKHQVKADGIDWESFKKNGITVASNVTIEPSDLGGYGIFYSGDEAVDDLIIARIPHAATFDLSQLMEIQNKLREVSPDASHIVKQVLSNCGGINETEVIIDYFFSFMIILTNETRPPNCPIISIEYYLEILSKTHVNTLSVEPNNEKEDADEYEHDYLVELERQKRKYLRKKYDLISESINELGVVAPSFEEYYHINKVIKSRVLEIPQAVEDEPIEEDFVVNTTLVPFLDFANHDEDNNAHFDVDRKTNDIVLKYLQEKPGKHEVFIKYSDVASVQLFVSTYGFIPKAKQEIFEIKIDERDIHELVNVVKDTKDVKYELIMKWLEILPTVQLISSAGKVGINYHANPIPFWVIFAENYEYLGWKDKLAPDIVNDPDICDPSDLKALEEVIRFQEEKCDVIQGIDKGVAIRPSEIPDLLESQQQEAIKMFEKFIKRVAKKRDVVKLTDLTSQYLLYKYKLFERILSQQNFELPYNPLWDEAYRYPPVTVYNSGLV